MLTRWRNWSDFPALGFGRQLSSLEELRREVDRLLFDFEREASPAAGAGTGNVTFRDQGAAYALRVELPGLSEKDVDLTLTANTLTLRAERKAEPPPGYSVHRRERAAYTLSRSYELPNKIDPDKAEAVMKNGVLTLTLPKAAEAQPKRIDVRAS